MKTRKKELNQSIIVNDIVFIMTRAANFVDIKCNNCAIFSFICVSVLPAFLFSLFFGVVFFFIQMCKYLISLKSIKKWNEKKRKKENNTENYPEIMVQYLTTKLIFNVFNYWNHMQYLRLRIA